MPTLRVLDTRRESWLRGHWLLYVVGVIVLLFVFGKVVSGQTQVRLPIRESNYHLHFHLHLTPKPHVHRHRYFQSNCARPVWCATCNAANNCDGADCATGCEDNGNTCQSCYKADGFAAPLTDAPLDELRQFSGYFDKQDRFVITVAGYLSKYGVSAGDRIQTINKWKVRPDRFVRLAKRKNGVMRLRVYKPTTRKIIVFYARP